MSDLLETHSSAWNRAHEIRRRVKNGWEHDSDSPIRLRGYTELVMGNIKPKLRKKIDTAIRRGYTLENRTQLPLYLSFIRGHNPIMALPIGYIGKTSMDIYLPNEDDVKELKRELQAQLVMTEAHSKGTSNFSVNAHRHSNYWVLRVSAYAADAAGKCPHLVSAFKEMRPAIDEWLSSDAHNREKIARWCANDASTIRVPFDSHRNR